MSNIAQFMSQLSNLSAHAHQKEKLDSRDELTHNAQELVSQSFFGTLLKQAQKSPFHSDMFEGGKGGEAYQELFNQKLAEHMAHGVGSKIVRPLVHKFHAGKAYQKHKHTAAHAKHHVHGFGANSGGSKSVSSFLANMGA